MDLEGSDARKAMSHWEKVQGLMVYMSKDLPAPCGCSFPNSLTHHALIALGLTAACS